MRKEAAGAPTLIAELFGQVTTDSFDVDYYIGSVSKTNDTAEGEAAYQAVLSLQNQGEHQPAVIVSDSERALTAMDGRAPQIGDRGGSETYVGPQGGVNSVLFTAVHHIWDQEAARRLGGLDLAHVKGHSKEMR